MTFEILIVTLVLLAALALLISERLPYDLTAIGIMVALMVTGVLRPADAVAGFANPAPVTVGALFIVTKGLMRTGGLVFLSRLMAAVTRGRPRLILLVSVLLVGLLSAFVNNTPVVVLMLSVILALSGRFDLSPARFLMPVSFASILAGTTTLIGTSTNIIVSDLAADRGIAPLGMFELARVGVPLAVVGIILVLLLADRLLPRTHPPIFHHAHGARHRYIAELFVPADSPAVGRDPAEALRSGREAPEVHEVLRGRRVLFPPTDDCTLAAGDLILVSATAAELVAVLERGHVTLPTLAGRPMDEPYREDTQLVEAIVPPESHLLGRRIGGTHLGLGDGLRVVGAQRRRRHYEAGKLNQLRLAVGDILLLQCSELRLSRLQADPDLIIADSAVPRPANIRKAPVAVVVFAGMVAAAAGGVTDIMTAALAAAFLMLVSGCLRLHEAYEAVDVPVLMLIVGTISLGTAMTSSGAADLYARGFLSVFEAGGPRVVLAAFVVLTSLLSHVLSNNSTAVLLVPVALATAGAYGVDPRPFLVGICFGASACFATPIGYQTNLLVYGPGGYRFADFLRLGMVLNLVVWVGASVLIPRYWSF
ncbi:SLC13 family permease [bacterium]|nr:SLC13 family permease [bacterium]